MFMVRVFQKKNKQQHLLTVRRQYAVEALQQTAGSLQIPLFFVSRFSFCFENNNNNNDDSC